MFDNVNLDNLKRCVRNNERAMDFDLLDYFSPCGTFGCLVGNDALAVGGFQRPLYDWARKQYGIYYTTPRHSLYTFLFGMSRRNGRYTKDHCINRLRKTIAYIERKRAIWYEADGRVSELARRKEGEFMVCASVMRSLATAV